MREVGDSRFWPALRKSNRVLHYEPLMSPRLTSCALISFASVTRPFGVPAEVQPQTVTAPVGVEAAPETLLAVTAACAEDVG